MDDIDKNKQHSHWIILKDEEGNDVRKYLLLIYIILAMLGMVFFIITGFEKGVIWGFFGLMVVVELISYFIPFNMLKLEANSSLRILQKSSMRGFIPRKKTNEIPFQNIKSIQIQRDTIQEEPQSDETFKSYAEINLKSNQKPDKVDVSIMFHDNLSPERIASFSKIDLAKLKADELAMLLECRVQNKVLGGNKV